MTDKKISEMTLFELNVARDAYVDWAKELTGDRAKAFAKKFIQNIDNEIKKRLECFDKLYAELARIDPNNPVLAKARGETE